MKGTDESKERRDVSRREFHSVVKIRIFDRYRVLKVDMSSQEVRRIQCLPGFQVLAGFLKIT